jgi:phosphoglycerate dehydrogenase-like enzyme
MSLNLLVCIRPHLMKPGTMFYWPDLLAGIKNDFDKHVKSYLTISGEEDYVALSEEQKLSFDVLVVAMGGVDRSVVEHQLAHNKNLKWIHALSAGIDTLVAIPQLVDSEITLTNAKGAYSSVLGEFIALGLLYHTKNVERFMNR